MPARIADKMRIHAGERLYFANSPADAVAAIDLPAVHIAKRLAGRFDHIILFTKTQRQLDARFPRLKRYLEANGKLCARSGCPMHYLICSMRSRSAVL